MMARRNGASIVLYGVVVVLILLYAQLWISSSSRSSRSASSSPAPKCPELPQTTPCPTPQDTEPPTAAPTDPPAATNKALVPTPSKPYYRLRIVVFTYRRIEGLKRLLKSLKDAFYMGHTVSLTVYQDFYKQKDLAKGDDGTRRFLKSEFVWPHGPMRIHRRLVNVGLKRSIMEAWYPSPTENDEVCAFFEDDIEVSPYWYVYGQDALVKYAGDPSDEEDSLTAQHAKLLGISLFRPIKDELSGRKCTVDNGDTPYLLQQPCSWGAIYLPRPWRLFRDWYDHYVQSTNDKNPTVITDTGKQPTSNTWDKHSSWKKYLIKLMYENGWFMVYPNLPDKLVLATNHLMEGEHPTPPKALFELPIFRKNHAMKHNYENVVAAESWLGTRMTAEEEEGAPPKSSGLFFDKMPPMDSLKVFDVLFSPVSKLDELPNFKKPLIGGDDDGA